MTTTILQHPDISGLAALIISRDKNHPLHSLFSDMPPPILHQLMLLNDCGISINISEQRLRQKLADLT